MRKRSAFGWMELIVGIVLVILGIFVITRTDAALTGVVMLYGLIAAITHCISRLSHLHMIRIAVGSFYYYVTLIVNILGLVLGCVMIIWPGISLFAVGVLIGGYLILAGIDSIVMAVSNIGC